MMNPTMFFWFLTTFFLTTVSLVEAQQPKSVHRIGYLSVLSPSSDSTRIEAFRQGLRELGYVEGQNIAIESRYAEGKLDRLPDLAGELVCLKVDVIVVGGSTATRAAKNVTKLIPIVMAHGSDPVEVGFVASLARPGGNVTGLSIISAELSGKRLELLREVVPGLSRVAFLWNPDVRGAVLDYRETESAAGSLGLQLQSVEVVRA